MDLEMAICPLLIFKLLDADALDLARQKPKYLMAGTNIKSTNQIPSFQLLLLLSLIGSSKNKNKNWFGLFRRTFLQSPASNLQVGNISTLWTSTVFR
jgi:hypothetical protein